jgi:hypothetical protein
MVYNNGKQLLPVIFFLNMSFILLCDGDLDFLVFDLLVLDGPDHLVNF